MSQQQAPNPWSRPGDGQPSTPGYQAPDYPGQPQPPAGYAAPDAGSYAPAGYPTEGYQSAPQGYPPDQQAYGHAAGQPEQQPYAQAGYQPVPYGSYGYPAPPLRTDYAPWGKRVGAMLVDNAFAYVALVIFYVGYGLTIAQLSQSSQPDPSDIAGPGSVIAIIGGIASLAAFAFTIYNRWFLAGRTGQSLGKRVAKIALISEETGAPIGPLNAFLRDLVHTLDGMAANIGYLWPLWDQKRQTFADKLMKTIVVRADQPGG